jgi:hypothetical protein
MVFPPSPGGDAIELIATFLSSAGSLLCGLVLVLLVLTVVFELLAERSRRAVPMPGPPSPRPRVRGRGPSPGLWRRARQRDQVCRQETASSVVASIRGHRRLVATARLRRYVTAAPLSRDWARVRYPH